MTWIWWTAGVVGGVWFLGFLYFLLCYYRVGLVYGVVKDRNWGSRPWSPTWKQVTLGIGLAAIWPLGLIWLGLDKIYHR